MFLAGSGSAARLQADKPARHDHPSSLDLPQIALQDDYAHTLMLETTIVVRLPASNVLAFFGMVTACGCSTSNASDAAQAADSSLETSLSVPSDAAVATPCPLPPGLPVFPGAQGAGTTTRAGRGGTVVEVTSLADSGPGTLREALDRPFARIIVFRIAGTIDLVGEIYVNHPFLTVAGQTAPGDGILLKGAGLVVNSHDVLIQPALFTERTALGVSGVEAAA